VQYVAAMCQVVLSTTPLARRGSSFYLISMVCSGDGRPASWESTLEVTCQHALHDFCRGIEVSCWPQDKSSMQNKELQLTYP